MQFCHTTPARYRRRSRSRCSGACCGEASVRAHHSRALQPLVPRGLHPSTRLHSAHWSDCLGQRRITQRIGRTVPLITVVTSAPAFPSPYFVSFTVAIASSSSLNRRTERTCDSRRHMGDQITVTCTSIGTPAASSAMPNTLAGQSELLGRIRVRKSLPSTSLSRSGLL